MKRLGLILVAILSCHDALLAQSDPIMAPYLFNPVSLNPAYTGINNRMELTSGFRKQWTGLEGSPSTLYFQGHLSLPAPGLGAGLMVMNDQSGASRQTLVQSMFGYHLQLEDNLQVAFGMQVGMVQFKSDYSNLNPYNPDDPAFSGSDRITKPTLGAGLLVRNDKLFLSLSVPRLLKAKEQIDGTNSNLYTQHFYINGAYVIGSGNYRFKPGFLLRMVPGAPLSADINFQLQVKENLSAGLFTRNFKNAGVLLRYLSPGNWWFGYAFEVPASSLVETRFLTHELTVGVRLKALSSHDALSVIEF